MRKVLIVSFSPSASFHPPPPIPPSFFSVSFSPLPLTLTHHKRKCIWRSSVHLPPLPSNTSTLLYFRKRLPSITRLHVASLRTSLARTSHMTSNSQLVSCWRPVRERGRWFHYACERVHYGAHDLTREPRRHGARPASPPRRPAGCCQAEQRK